METRHLLSVILPVRNPDTAKLKRCLASFDALPSASRIEVIVVRTGMIAESILGGFSRIAGCQVAESSEVGIYAAFNTGIAVAQGRFLLFFGHDDIPLPAMENVLSYLAGQPGARMLVACGMYVEGVGIRWPSRLRQGIVFRNWGHQALFYSADLLQGISYDLRYPLRADHRLNIALLGDPSVRCVRLPLVVSWFARGGFSTRTIADREFDARQATFATEAFGSMWGWTVRLLLPVVRIGRRVIRRMLLRQHDSSCR
jgi:glycosyltransferase involved in cell wall biosynthesis